MGSRGEVSRVGFPLVLRGVIQAVSGAAGVAVPFELAHEAVSMFLVRCEQYGGEGKEGSIRFNGL